MANTLMFEVGIQKAQGEYDKIYNEVMKLAQMGKDGIKLSIALDKTADLQTFMNMLKNLGDGKLLQPLIEKIEQLQVTLAKFGAVPKDFDMSAVEKNLKNIDRLTEQILTKRQNLSKQGKTGGEINTLVANLENQKQAYQNALSVLTGGMSEQAVRIIVDNNRRIQESMQQMSGSAGNIKVDGLDKLQQKVVETSDKVSALSEKLANAGGGKINLNLDMSAIEPTLKSLQSAVDQLEKSMNLLWSATQHLETSMKALGGIEALEKIKTEATATKQQVDNLAQSVSGMTKQAEKKGSEAILADNLQRLKTAIKDVIAEQDRLNEAYGVARNMGMPQNAEIEQRINLLRLLIQSMQNLAAAASDVTSKEAEMLSKSKAFSFVDFSGTGAQLFSKDTTHLYSKKEIDGYIKSIEEFIKAEGRMAQTSGSATNTIAEIGTAISRAAERASHAGTSFSQTTQGIQNFATNIETARLAYDKTLRSIADLESRISAGQKAGLDKDSLDFMNGLKQRAQQWADVLKKILGEDLKGNPAYREFLSMSSSILTKPQMGNGLQALLGADWKILLKTIGDTFGMLMKFSGFSKNLTLDNTTLTNWLKGEEAVRRLDNALKDLNRQWAATNKDAKTPDLTAKYEAQKRAIESLIAQIKGAMTEEARMSNRNGLADFLGVGYRNAIGYDNTRLIQEMRKESVEADRNTKAKQQVAAANTHLTSTEQQLANAIKGSTDHMKSQSQVMSDLKMMATQYLGVWGAQGFLRNVIEIGGQLEMQRLSIGAILGDMAKASELFDRIKNLAIKSPFGVVELDQMTKQLSAYGFEYKELFDMTKRLADISAATGTGVDRLALALGHVRSEAALSGYTLRQFSMANIPLAKKLSEELTKVEGKLVSVADVRKRVRTKDISYEQVLKVLKDLTDEGGMFYNAQEIMSESVKARFKNLKDSMDIMYGEIAESSVGKGLKEVATLLTTLTRHWQELGAVIIAGTSYWAINRVAMMASNKAMVQGNLILGRFTASQLEMQATTGNLTRAQLLQAVATKKLAVADAEAAGAVLALSKAQLQHVANTGKVSSALNIATIATSKYSVAQLRAMAITKNMGFGATVLAYLQRGWIGVSTAATAAATAVWGFVKAMWPMLAISAIVEVLMSIKRESEQFADAANYVGQSARNMMKDIDEAIASVSKNGKPVDTEALREAVNTMKEVLENSEFYTEEQQKQIDNAKTLSEKYDILLKQMKEMKEEAEWQTNNEGLIEKILANTGKNINVNTAKNWNGQTGQYETVTSQMFGSRFFNDSLQENIEQVNKSNASLLSAINLLSEYQNVIEDAIRKNNNFGLSLDGKTWQEKVRLIAESGQWDKFIASVENAGSRFEKTASKVKVASNKVAEDWREIVNDDVKAIRLTLMQEWGMTEDEITQFAKNNERTMRWLVDSIAKSLSKLGVAEAIIDEFKRKLLELFGVAGSGKPTKKEPNEYQKQTDLAKRILGNVIRKNRKNGKNGQGVTTVKEINDIVGTGEHVKTESEVVKALKERAQKDHETMKDVKRIYGETSKEYQKAKKKYEHSLNLAESNGIKESEILTGKYKDKTSDKGSHEDKQAKELRERVRILKEAESSFQYWRKAVGDAASATHVNEEFGKILSEQGFSFENVEQYKNTLEELRVKYQGIYDTSEKAGKKRPQLLEAIKEIDKILADIGRKDFEKKTEEFLSRTQIELDNLTRAWETFNSVREATGDLKLAIELSGAEYVSGQTQNLADAIKKKIEKDFASFGSIGIPFNINFSDREIKEKIESAMPQAAEEQIAGLIEEYKKWRDLQRDVLKRDINTFAKLVGSAKDYDSQLKRINDELEKQIEANERLVEQGVISRADADKANEIALFEARDKAWKASVGYSQLFNNSLALTRQEIENGINLAMDMLNEKMRLGLMTAQEYADEMAKIRDIQSEWTKNSVLGGDSRFWAGAKGGLQGISQYNQRNLNRINTEIAEIERKARSGQSYDGARLYELKEKKERGDNYGKYIDSLGGVFDKFDALSKALDPVISLFDKLGMSVVGEALGIGKDALNQASAFGSAAESVISGAGPYGAAIGAGLSIASGLFGMFDAALQEEIDASKARQQEMENLTKNLEKALERTLGGVYRTENSTEDRRKLQEYRERYMTQAIVSDSLSRIFAGEGLSKEAKAFYAEVDKAFNKAQQTNSYYDTQRAFLYAQQYELQKQLSAEQSKKNSDDSAIADYKQQLAELEDQIKYFALDMAKALYDIDIQSWASDLTDAIVDAWENGEDAAEAYANKVKDLMKDLTKNILTKKVMEKAFENAGIDKLIADMMDVTSGKLDYTMVPELAKALAQAGQNSTDIITRVLDELERQGYIDKGNGDSSGSVTSGIKSITEQTADLLASYLNATRASTANIENLSAQYFPLFYQAITSNSYNLRNIENHTAAIMRSNDTIADKITSLDNNITGLRNNVWRVPVS